MERQLLVFLFGCVTVRLALAEAVRRMPSKGLKFIAGPLLMVPAIGFSVIYIFGLRSEGAETFGAKLWWNDFRPIHAGLFFVASVRALAGTSSAHLPLFADAVLGLIFSLLHYYGHR